MANNNHNSNNSSGHFDTDTRTERDPDCNSTDKSHTRLPKEQNNSKEKKQFLFLRYFFRISTFQHFTYHHYHYYCHMKVTKGYRRWRRIPSILLFKKISNKKIFYILCSLQDFFLALFNKRSDSDGSCGMSFSPCLPPLNTKFLA